MTIKQSPAKTIATPPNLAGGGLHQIPRVDIEIGFRTYSDRFIGFHRRPDTLAEV